MSKTPALRNQHPMNISQQRCHKRTRRRGLLADGHDGVFLVHQLGNVGCIDCAVNALYNPVK